MEAKASLPERVLSNEGLGVWVQKGRLPADEETPAVLEANLSCMRSYRYLHNSQRKKRP